MKTHPPELLRGGDRRSAPNDLLTAFKTPGSGTAVARISPGPVKRGEWTGTFRLLVALSLIAYGLAGAFISGAQSTSEPPAITTQPVNKTVKVGASAKFSVTATGSAPLSYQWAKNGVNIAGAIGASYITPPVTRGDSGSLFSVVVSNSVGSVTSDNAKLTVKKPPAITIQPSDETVTVGETATFSVVATGTAPLSYQWSQDGVDIAGATSASYTTPATTMTDDGTLFAATVSNSVGSVTSTSAMLTVNPLDNGNLEQYGTTSTGVALRWKAFEPAGGGKHPAVIVLHAGGFKAGHAGPDFVSEDLAKAGFLALSTEYRLAPPHTPMNTPDHPAPSQNTVVPVDEGLYPKQTMDVQMAIRAARSDPRCDGRVYGVGGSAGASHVLYMAATGTPGDDQLDLEVCLSGMYKFDDIEWLNDSCHPGDSCTPQLMENYLGLPAGSALLHLPELAAASPITYVTQAIPPVFILASDHDGGGADRYQFPDLIDKLESIGVTESTDGTPQRQHYKRLLVQVITKKHSFEYWSEPISPGNPVLVKDQIIAFLAAGPPP